MRLASYFLLPLLVLQVGVTTASATDPAVRCIDQKNKAAARALRCIARQEQKAILGRTSDPSICDAALARAFATAEKSGACAITGDLAAVQLRVETAAANVLDALHAGMASTTGEKRCLIKENNAAAGFAVCIANTISKRLRGLPLSVRIVIGTDIGQCKVAAWRPFTNSDDCLVGFIGRQVPLDFANAAAGNLEGVNAAGAEMNSEQLAGANLRNADLSGTDLGGTNLANADLSGANLAGADLRADLDGADLSNVTWNATLCPDGTRSDTNGSSPESCCGNLQVGVPAACSP